MHALMNAEASTSARAGDIKMTETVLLVDDSRAHRRLMCDTLRRSGFEPLDAEDGVEALAICQREGISLVVSDWMIPDINGVESCREYRALIQGRPGYFILLIARTEREVLAQGFESGADDFLSKPVSSVELRARLRAGLRALNVQRDLATKNDEILRTLDQLSEAYAAIDRDLREARGFRRRSCRIAICRSMAQTFLYSTNPADMLVAIWLATFPFASVKLASTPPMSRVMASARRL